MIIKGVPIELLPDASRFGPVFLRQFCNFASVSISAFYYNWENIRRCYEGSNPFNQHTLTFDDDYICKDKHWRFMHIDLSKSRDSTGICVSHIPTYVYLVAKDQASQIEKRELFPFVKIDFLGRILPREQQGGFIDPAIIREIIFEFRKRGFPIRLVTFDQYQSWDSINRMREKGIVSAEMSIDRTTAKIIVDHKKEFGFRKEPIKNYAAPHENFRNILADFRLKMPYYKYIEKEMREQDDIDGLIAKIPGGADDVIQAVAGSVFDACNNIAPFVSDRKEDPMADLQREMLMKGEQQFREMLDGEKVAAVKGRKRVDVDPVPVGRSSAGDDFNELLM